MIQKTLLAALVLWVFSACQPSSQENKDVQKAAFTEMKSIDAKADIDPYWMQGKAEISSYELDQSRYGEIHQGHAVLVFVTEDFLIDKQVKNERYSNQNSTLVLKTNHLRKFPTGIYDYALMTSVFNPVDTRKYPHALKVSFSAQDWCGQGFMQVNQRNNGYEVEVRSYFESEGDQDYTIEKAYTLEDEIFNLIRLDPDLLPTGKGKMLPSATYARLMHRDFKPYAVESEISAYSGTDFPGSGLMVYTVNFPDLNRKLEFIYESDPPYKIAGWKDQYRGGYGPSAKSLTTIARRKKTILSAYWNQHDLADQQLRIDLGLP